MEQYIIYKPSECWEAGDGEGKIIGNTEIKEMAEYFKTQFNLEYIEIDSDYLKVIFDKKLKIFEVRVNKEDYSDFTIKEEFYPLDWHSDLINKRIRLQFEHCAFISPEDPRCAYCFEVMALNKLEAVNLMKTNLSKLITDLK